MRSIETTREVVLAHNQRMLSVEFASLSYVNPAEMLYRYKLEGFDDKWYVTDGRNRIVNYNNLPAKRYTLRIESADNNGVWGSGQTVLDIVVRPHALRSPLAFTLYALVLLLALTALIRYLLRRSDPEARRETPAIRNEDPAGGLRRQDQFLYPYYARDPDAAEPHYRAVGVHPQVAADE